MSVSQILEKDRAIGILLALSDEIKHIRALQRSVGGSPATIQRRVESLLEAKIIREVGGRGARRYLELTDKGRRLATVIASMDKTPSGRPKKPSLGGRQKWMLILLHGVGEVQGTTRLEKLLFLLKEEYKVIDEDYYHFKPHLFGPYPQELPSDVRDLRAAEFIDVEEEVFGKGEMGDWIYLRKTYDLTTKGDDEARSLYAKFSKESGIVEAMRRMQEFNAMPLNNLLSYTWRKYPQYTRPENAI